MWEGPSQCRSVFSKASQLILVCSTDWRTSNVRAGYQAGDSFNEVFQMRAASGYFALKNPFLHLSPCQTSAPPVLPGTLFCCGCQRHQARMCRHDGDLPTNLALLSVCSIISPLKRKGSLHSDGHSHCLWRQQACYCPHHLPGNSMLSIPKPGKGHSGATIDAQVPHNVVRGIQEGYRRVRPTRYVPFSIGRMTCRYKLSSCIAYILTFAGWDQTIKLPAARSLAVDRHFDGCSLPGRSK